MVGMVAPYHGFNAKRSTLRHLNLSFYLLLSRSAFARRTLLDGGACAWPWLPMRPRVRHEVVICREIKKRENLVFTKSYTVRTFVPPVYVVWTKILYNGVYCIMSKCPSPCTWLPPNLYDPVVRLWDSLCKQPFPPIYWHKFQTPMGVYSRKLGIYVPIGISGERQRVNELLSPRASPGRSRSQCHW